MSDPNLAADALVVDAFPLTQLQLSMAFHSRCDLDVPLYNNVFSFTVPRKFCGNDLKQAIKDIVQRHEALRTTFNFNDFSKPMQLVYKDWQYDFSVDHFELHEDSRRREVIIKWIEKSKHDSFDLKTGPKIIFRVHVWSENEFQLSIKFHHAMLDGLSIATLATELFAVYSAILEKRTLCLAPVPEGTFRHFVQLELDAIAAQVHRSFWKRYLHDFDARVMRENAGKAGLASLSEIEITIPSHISDALASAARSNGMPASSAYLTAYLRTISALSGRRDVVSGMLTNTRPNFPGADRALGLFFNIVPVRVLLKRGTWRDIMVQTHAAVVEAMQHKRFPLAEIAKQFSGTLPFDSVFIFNDYKKLSEGAEAGLKLNNVLAVEQTDFPIVVRVQSSPETSLYTIVVQCRGIDANHWARSVGDGFLATIQALAENPEAYHDELALAVGDRCCGHIPEPSVAQNARHIQVHQQVEDIARRYPNRTAATLDRHTLSYSELNLRANRLANHLLALGLGREDLVALCLDRSLDLLVALLAVQKSGGAFVPLSPMEPAGRLSQILRETAVRFAITSANGFRPPTLPSVSTICLDADQAAISSRSTRNPARPQHSQDLAYVIHTSGTGGAPKRVMISRRSFSDLLTDMQKRIAVSPEDVWALVTAPSFDIGLLEVFLPLVNGASIKIVSQQGLNDARAWLAALAGTTVIQATPSAWRLLLDAGWSDGAGVTAISGGEVLPIDLAARLLETGVRLHNYYGPTETTIWSTGTTIETAGAISIGKPLARTQTHVLDVWQQLAPTGVAGELYIAGVGLARGYFGQPGLTAERFLPDPFGPPGSRCYRTGDRVRVGQDGNLYFLGRLDRQLKINGVRVEPEEIEAVILRHPNVREAVVRASSYNHGTPHLSAFIVSRDGASKSSLIEDLNEHLKRDLPPHLIPTRFALLDAIPRLPNGKIDDRSLPEPQLQRHPVAYEAPRTRTQRVVSSAFEDCFGLERVSLHDDFFSLGGDSHLCLVLVSRLEAELGLTISMRSLLLAPTVKSFADWLDREIERLQAKGASEDQKISAFVANLTEQEVLALVQDPLIRNTMGPSLELFNKSKI